MGNNLFEYLQGRHKPENVNAKHEQSLSTQDRIALLSTKIIGTMYAVYFFMIVLAGWTLWQTFFTNKPFDPYPFAFLLFLGNIVQLLLMPLLIVGQNLQGRHSEVRVEEEFKTTQSSYKDIEQILLHLNSQDEQMKKQLEILLALADGIEKKRKSD